MATLARSLSTSACMRIECMRAFSTYDAYSRAAPERRTEARARVIPRRPKAVTIEMIVAITRISTIENPLGLRVFKLAFVFCLGIIWSKSIFAVVQRPSPLFEQEWCHENSSVKTQKIQDAINRWS